MIYDLAIIGGGPAGYTAAELAATNGFRTVLFEKGTLGGICLNEGCIPTKTLLYSAKIYHSSKEAQKYGVSCSDVSFDLPKVITRKNKVVRKLTAGIRARMQEAGVDVMNGLAVITGEGQEGFTITCNEQTITAGKLLLCMGSDTVIPPIPGLSSVDYWTSKEALENKDFPESLLIIGGGVIGIEFASFYNTIGTKVIVVEMLDEILTGMDKEISAMLRAEYTKRGIEFHLGTKVLAVNGQEVEIEKDGVKSILSADKILLSTGRKANLQGSGIESISLETFKSGLKVNEHMQTSNKNVYACGDITGFSLLAHTAVHEAEIAVAHMLGENAVMNYDAIPAVVYTNPEFAGVGKTEETLKSEGISYKVKQLPLAYSGRFVAENEMGNGVCKILLSDDDTILGVHMLGNPASEIIITAGIAIAKKMKADELKHMVFPHPTVGEIIKETL